jgi:hypothetical protein
MSVSFHQDLRLLTLGDKIANDPGTLNLITKIKYEGRQKKAGFLVFGVEYEIANINKTYRRYGISSGYTFNTLFGNESIHITPYLGIGGILRMGRTSLSCSGSLQISYALNKTIQISSLFQLTHRTDLLHLYNNNVIRGSFFIGLEFDLFRFES